MTTSRRFAFLAILGLAWLSGAAVGQAPQTGSVPKTADETDKIPIQLTLDPLHPGRVFDGIGGNFRLQNLTADPPVIEYNLKNLPVAWARVAMPWNQWHPAENTDPIDAAKAGKLNQNVHRAMDMARTLAQRRLPIIISIWSPPSWAVLPAGKGGRGKKLNPEKWDAISKSICAYIIYMKDNYGAEPALFSFNESEMGIDVLQSAAEHVVQIKMLGAYFATQGLETRMLLGDTGNARGINFIKLAMDDPEALKYVTAVSFHSWNGGTDQVLSAWGDAAKKLGIPLLVAEAGTDPQAYRDPAKLESAKYSLDEINLYVRICALCQPRSLMQWQLTADYSLLAGYSAGRGAPTGTQTLRPTQRFWNLKQLGSTSAGAFALPAKCDRPALTCAAFGDIARGVYTVHLVNTGATRQATLTGLPAGVKELRVYVTDAQRGMQEGERIAVSGGTAQFVVDAATFTTVTGNH
jgi:hypothetical protein